MYLNFESIDQYDYSNQYDSVIKIVIDNGSGMIKAGIAGEETPKYDFPSIIGKEKNLKKETKSTDKFYIGNEAFLKREILSIQYPIQRGIIQDWENIEKIWNHVLFNELKIFPEQTPVLLTEPPFNPNRNREKMIEIMFETFNIPYSYIAIQGILSLYAAGRTTGIVLDIGDGVAHSVPIYEGYTFPHAISRMNLAGRDLTDYLMKILNEKEYQFTTTSERETVKDIKEKLCYVAEDFDKEIKNSTQSNSIQENFQLPDGKFIKIGNERFICPEVLFNPSLIGMEHQGIHQMIHNSISKCDQDVTKDLYSNIVLSGGSSLFPGIETRTQSEIEKLIEPSMRVNVFRDFSEVSGRKNMVWIGGSILASLIPFKDMWISRKNYLEFGSLIVHKKCY
ncbi:actin-7-related [Anaeramoeba ignava]|uniref:Actin-7-related n=1 Tax=Anaeramoeba ignava TaxID=1746090 RepID=A0A9Q0LKK6_ANAIG|nr:actin-7-related [Anaeramoeba ignava]